jgi:hypothetical protein
MKFLKERICTEFLDIMGIRRQATISCLQQRKSRILETTDLKDDREMETAETRRATRTCD